MYFKNLTPSKIEATANKVDGDISDLFLQIEFRRLSDVPLSSSSSSLNLSVLAVHKTITWSNPLDFLKSLISALI